MAITNNDGYTFINTILRKEKAGSPLTPNRYNNMLKIASWEKANAEYSLFEEDQVSTDTIESLKAEEIIAIDGSGAYTLSGLSNTYWHPCYANYLNGALYSEIDFVGEKEWNRRITSSLELPTTDFPIGKVIGGDLEFNPITSTNVNFCYLSEPTTPFFDWYVDANVRIQYLEEGETYTLQASETYTDKTDGSLLTAGDVIGDAGDDAINQTTEMSFPEGERIDVFYKILQKLSISVTKQDALQYGLAREVKEEQQ